MKNNKFTIKERKALKKKAWTLFAKYIRERDSNICITCGRSKSDGYVMNAGHFIHNRLDFDEKNIHCQCFVCNKIKKGNMKIFCIRMVEWYGLDYVKKLLECEKEKPRLESGDFYLNIIDKYTRK